MNPRKLIVVCLITLFPLAASAGFLGNVFSSMVANSLTGSDGKTMVYEKAKDAKKAQFVLKVLGFYDYTIDGELNSFDSREAIKEWQKIKRDQSPGSIKKKGVLSEDEQLDLLYFGDIIDKFAQVKLEPTNESIESYVKRKEKILRIAKEFNETNYDVHTTVAKMQEELDVFKTQEMPDLKRFMALGSDYYILLNSNQLFWIPTTRRLHWSKGLDYCRTQMSADKVWKNVTTADMRKSTRGAVAWAYKKLDGGHWCGTKISKRGDKYIEQCTQSTRGGLYEKSDRPDDKWFKKSKDRFQGVVCTTKLFETVAEKQASAQQIARIQNEVAEQAKREEEARKAAELAEQQKAEEAARLAAAKAREEAEQQARREQEEARAAAEKTEAEKARQAADRAVASEAKAAKQASAPTTVSELLATAEQQIRKNRLTSPAGDNALETLASIDKLDPANADARTMRATVAGKYKRWARSALSKGQAKKAKGYLRKAERAVADDQETADLMAQADRVQAAQAAQQASTKAPKAEAPAETTATASPEPAPKTNSDGSIGGALSNLWSAVKTQVEDAANAPGVVAPPEARDGGFSH